MATNTSSLEASRNGVLWVIQVFGAMLLFMTASVKLSGSEQVIEMFAAVGMGQCARYVTGIIELASAILLLIPTLSGIGALLLVATMIGAILMQVFIIGGNPALPIVLLMIATVVAWGRKATTLRLIWRTRS